MNWLNRFVTIKLSPPPLEKYAPDSKKLFTVLKISGKLLTGRPSYHLKGLKAQFPQYTPQLLDSQWCP